jgi:Kef-type K+ transport system membrane component KefB
MATYIIITLCILTLIAYLFDLSVKKTRIPGVILLLVLGIGLRLAGDLFSITVPEVRNILRVLGIIGLLLIVLEGCMDLELRKEKLPLIKETFFAAFAIFVVTTGIIVVAFHAFLSVPVAVAVINAIPLGIISSSVAISSVAHLDTPRREFVVYESSFSDILGILFFNFFATNDGFDVASVAGFLVQLIIILAISGTASVGLGILLNRISHPVKIIPIITILVLLYSVAEHFHLPSLILILVFGLFLNNTGLLPLGSRPLRLLHRMLSPERLATELMQFKQLVTEMTFIVRSFFFILFGYSLHLVSLIDPASLAVSLAITAAILAVRSLYFRWRRLPWDALLYVIPRGLITILLFLSIGEGMRIPLLTEGLLSQIIVITSLIMMAGLMKHREPA